MCQGWVVSGDTSFGGLDIGERRQIGPGNQSAGSTDLDVHVNMFLRPSLSLSLSLLEVPGVRSLLSDPGRRAASSIVSPWPWNKELECLPGDWTKFGALLRGSRLT